MIGCGVWLEAPEAVRRQRVEQRESLALDSWWDAWAEQEVTHFSAQQTAERASVTILTG
jgi:cytidylate kinase